ncbi:stress response protein NST1-like [Nicotiana sylvestris]|uniref:stress response protein NST1-like n=1 Tax=Nicotiana sylvestris TaxID=4096 RepID=UPI00388C9D1F
MDLATKGRTRPSMAKVRVEIDLLKEQSTSVYVVQIYDNAPQKGFVQKIEFEGVPKYCKFCRKLGHNLVNCRSLERKKASENRELEAQKNAENQNEDNRLLGDQNMESGNKLGTVTNRENTRLVDQSSETAATVSAESVEAGTDANAGQSEHRINQKQKNENLKIGTTVDRESVRLGDQNKESKVAEYAEFAGPAEHTDQNKNYISAESAASETANKARQQEHSFSQKEKSEKQNPRTVVYSENLRLVDQNKEFKVDESVEIDKTGTATNTEQTINRISRMKNNESKFDKHLQQPPSNIRERSRKKTKKKQKQKTSSEESQSLVQTNIQLI